MNTESQATILQTRAALPRIHTDERWLQHGGLRYCSRVIRHPCPEFEPTLFLSGAFQTMESWARFARAFAPFTTVVLVDPPGMGRSDVLPADVGLDFLAHTIRQVLDESGIGRVNIVAASYGTPAAYRFAQLHPDRIARIVLAGTMREIPPHLRDRVRQSVTTALAGNRELLAEQIVSGLLCQDPCLGIDRRAVAERVLRSGLLRMSDAQVRQYAANTTRLLEHPALELRPRVRGPEALVFTGEHDCFTVPAHCRDIADAFDDSWFTTVRRADHLFHIEQFDVVIGLLLRFMRGRLREGAPGCSAVHSRRAAEPSLSGPVLS